MSAILRAAGVLLFTLVLGVVSRADGRQEQQPPPDLAALAATLRETLRRDYATPRRFTYVEESRDVDISKLGKVSVGPLQTFEVYPVRVGESWKRLIAVDGKPLDPAALARADAEHERDVRKRAERERSETARQRTARLSAEAEEARDRDAILDDASAVFEFAFICRETLDGEPVVVVSLTPRPNARVTTREGSMMKQFSGKLWIAEHDGHLARVVLRAQDHVSIGWGVVARIEPGSGFDFVRKKFGDAWVPAQLTVEGSGRTLLLRRFQVKTVSTYSRHRPYLP